MRSLAAVLLLSAGLVPAAQLRVDAARRSLGPEPNVLSVWTGPVVRALSLGYSDLLADLYWMRAVQYYGTQKLAAANFPDLDPLLDTAAELDPRFLIVYQYGAVFLSEPSPLGAGRPEAGVALVGRGADRNPLEWRLRQDQGFYTFVYLKDAPRAAEILLRASRVPGSGPWLPGMAAHILGKGGELEGALRIWTLIRDQSEPGALRDVAEDQVKATKNRILVKQVQEQVLAYRERTGDHASTLPRLKAAGVIEAAVDLAGIPFDYDAESGTVAVSRKSPLWRGQ